ncbi:MULTISPECIES: C40 family peptidase [Nocardia]|uniref:C40 family peptidase n=1 Tax=Nocardia TaxID=1817 RepID=UPI0007EB284A|nr:MULTISPECIES: C40 family peptidase [Nocardia]OBA49758.1 hydrolase [Nocardia sp. 852002-51101_SCH5132738]OBB37098.1 hydrolase [Nocardia sp. 852002-51244_SCH5132740]OBF68346.1 hydrolase [Mycobacterium sp. 852002-51759_SCH5129042]
MGKHSLQRESRLPNSVKGALVCGAVAATTGAIPAIPAMAATINVPGVGNFDVPLGSEFDQQVSQANQVLADHADQIKGVQQALSSQAIAPSIPNAAQNPMSGMFGQPQQQHGVGDVALDAARSKIGADYVWGASGPSNFDCSGLVQWAYKQAGIQLPRTSFEQSHVGKPVAFQDLKPGDLVIQNGGGHVSMYAGDGKILQAPQSGETVSYAHLDPDSIVTARRVA